VAVKRISNVDWDKDLDKVFGKKFRSIVSQIIVKGMKDGLQAGKDIKGKKFKKLKAATVRSKKKKGYRSPSKPLIATGTMKKLPPVKHKRSHSEIDVAKSRSSIAMYHNEGGSKRNQPPKRQWYGVTEDAKKNIARAVGKKVVGILKKGFRL
tara:strand:+ start:2433 stop:2888 length:456 start_codon:yes stop_codon:yes gene_type:complete